MQTCSDILRILLNIAKFEQNLAIFGNYCNFRNFVRGSQEKITKDLKDTLGLDFYTEGALECCRIDEFFESVNFTISILK